MSLSCLQSVDNAGACNAHTSVKKNNLGKCFTKTSGDFESHGMWSVLTWWWFVTSIIFPEVHLNFASVQYSEIYCFKPKPNIIHHYRN